MLGTEPLAFGVVEGDKFDAFLEPVTRTSRSKPRSASDVPRRNLESQGTTSRGYQREREAGVC